MSSSVTSSFQVGRQTNQATAATKYRTALATVSGLNVEFDEKDERIEHPGLASSGRVTGKKAALNFTGYKVPWKATFAARPNFLPDAFALVGCGIVTTADATVPAIKNHACTIADASSFGWFTVQEKHVDNASVAWYRRARASRGKKFSVKADPNAVICDIEGLGLVELNGAAITAANETVEVSDELEPTLGSLTIGLSGITIPLVRGLTMDFETSYDEDDKALFQTARAGLNPKKQTVKGTITGIDVLKDVYERIVRGAVGGTAVSTAVQTSALSWEFQSAGLIPGGAIPYKWNQAFTKVQWKMGNIEAKNDDEIRFDLEWEMVDDNTTPMTATITNLVAAYVA